MHIPESVLKNETYNIFWDFKVQMNLLIRPESRYTDNLKKEKKRRDLAV